MLSKNRNLLKSSQEIPGRYTLRTVHAIGTLKCLKIFFLSFFNYFYYYFRFAGIRASLVIFMRREKGSYRYPNPLQRFAAFTGIFYSTKWIPGIITNSRITRFFFSKACVPPLIWHRPNLVILLSNSRVALQELQTSRVPAVHLFRILPVFFLELLDFTYILGAYFYNLWFVSKSSKTIMRILQLRV